MNKKGNVWEVFMGICILCVFIAVFAYAIAYLNYAVTEDIEEIRFDEKWVKYQNQKAKYLVSSTSGEVYEISDSLLHMRYDSSNLYNEIESGKTCTIITQGFRVGFLSWYKNIIKAWDCS